MIADCNSVNPNPINSPVVKSHATKVRQTVDQAFLQARTAIASLGVLRNHRYIDFHKLSPDKAKKVLAHLELTKASIAEGLPHASYLERKIDKLKKWIAHESSERMAGPTEKVIYHSYWTSVALKYIPLLEGPFVRVGDFQLVASLTLALGVLTSTFTLIKESLYMKIYEKWIEETKVRRIDPMRAPATVHKLNGLIKKVQNEGVFGPTYGSFCERIATLFEGQDKMTLKPLSFIIGKLKDDGIYDKVVSQISSSRGVSVEETYRALARGNADAVDRLAQLLREQTAPASDQSLYTAYAEIATNNFRTLCKDLIAAKHKIGHTFMQIRLTTAAILFPLSVLSTTLVVLANLALVTTAIGVMATFTASGVALVLVAMGLAIMHHYRKGTLDSYRSTIHIRLLMYDLAAWFYRWRRKCGVENLDNKIKGLEAKSGRLRQQLKEVGAKDFQDSLGVDERYHLSSVIEAGLEKYEKFLTAEDKAMLKREMGSDPEEFFALDEDGMILFMKSVITREEIDLDERS